MSNWAEHFKQLWLKPRPGSAWCFSAWLYGQAQNLRRRAYEKGLLKSQAAGRPVISVGNLVVGGTGKTPVTIWLADYFLKRGLVPAILSRGYGRRSKGDLVVSAGQGPVVEAALAGDEPFLIARKVPQALVLVGRRRAPLAEKALGLGADLFIMDDGFQHLALKRDLDLVVFKTPQAWGNGLLLPAGPLREPWSALKAADGLIFTGGPQAESRHPPGWDSDKATFQAVYQPDGLYLWSSRCYQPPESWADLKVAAFCGLGQPEGFYELLRQHGLNALQTKNWPDHHQYPEATLTALDDWANRLGVDFLITTEKDAVKIDPVHPLSQRLLVLSLAVSWQGGADFGAWVASRLFPQAAPEPAGPVSGQIINQPLSLSSNEGDKNEDKSSGR